MPRGRNDYETAQIQGRLWTPAVLSPGLWLDCSDLSTMSMTGSVITTLRDKSGNARNATAVNSPTLIQEGKNGLALGRVTAASQDCWTIDLDWLAGAGQNHTAVAGYKFDSSKDATLYGATNGNAGAGSLHVGWRGPNYPGGNFNKLLLNYWANDTETSAPSSLDLSIGNVYCWIWNTAAVRTIRARGSDTGATGPSTSQIAAMSGGGRIFRVCQSGSGGPWYEPPTADLYELIIAPRLLSRQEYLAAEGYLAWKWGLPIAADHPFANRPPLIGD